MIRVGEVLIDPETEEKLWTKHQLTAWEVRQVAHDPDAEPPRWVEDEHGGRLIVRGWTQTVPAKMVFISLRPIDWDEGVWALITAFVPDHSEYGSEEGEEHG